MKRWLLAWAVALVLVGGAAQRGFAQDGHGDEGDTAGAADESATSVLRGAAVYAGFCQACHGPQGDGAAEGPAFPAIEFDEARLREVLAQGAVSDVDGSAMPAYDAVLTAQQMDDLAAYMTSWDEGDTPPLPAPNVHVAHRSDPDVYGGHPEEGAVLYAIYCSGCHGVDGAGRGEEAFPELVFEGERSLQVVRSGHDNDYMPAFAVENGGPLDDAAVANLASYMATWQVVEEETDGVDGVGILVMFAGLAVILGVGIAYLGRQRVPPAD
jgi:mono/diheme cytochrome c family protein